jgi:hypothetical protein
MLGWFGRKSGPERQAFVPAWLSGEGEQGGFARGYQAQLDEVYRRNPVGLRAVRLVAGLAGGLPLFGDAKAVALVKADGLLERAAAALLLHGNAYARLVTDSHDRPAELHLMRPERVSVVSRADGWPAAYLYRGGGQVVRVARDDALGRRQVVHLKALDPSDDHYDAERDYQAGQMRSSGGGRGNRDERIEISAVLAATQAKRLVEEAYERRWQSGDRLKLRLPPAWMDMRPGNAIQLENSTQAWVVRSLSIEAMSVVIEAEQAPATVPALPAAPGRSIAEPDVAVGRTALALFEMPALGDAPEASVKVRAAAGNDGLWRRVPAELALGTDAPTALAMERRAVLGSAESVLDARAPLVLDDISSVVIRLINKAQHLLNADALMAGTNLAILGDELLQFGRAEQLGDGLYRLSKLLRGRRGTEWAAVSHAAGDRFCMMDAAAMRTVELPASAVSAMLNATAHGIGDSAPLPVAGRAVTGEALRPPSPCRVSLTRDGPDVRAEWIRRSHRGWGWIDGVGVPEDSFPEVYRLSLAGPGGETIAETATASAIFPIAELPAGPGEEITLAVMTVGPVALSRPAFAIITL